MSHLSIYLDQISVSCQGIESLPFPPPKVFTNALLYNDDITSLIRDTEAHERALFSVPSLPPTAKTTTAADANTAAANAASSSSSSTSSARRRQTVFNVAGGEVTTGPPLARPSAAPRRQTAVAAVLGGDLHAQISQRGGTGTLRGGSGGGGGNGDTGSSGGGGDVDVNVLLKGAEKLCSVYALPGALERIPQLRQKYEQQSSTLAYYEAKVAEQAQRLDEMNRGWRDGMGGGGGGDDDDVGDDDVDGDATAILPDAPPDAPTEADLRREEDDVRELERRKRELQERLRTMDKDLGGLLNM
ncbi:dash complex, subunit spc34 [Niveomyces insectorum RCEF 264]|uniref:DASH complex subunit SPC34 n=1 Tax=Niveomyces insectorum RCEF 264 TaxID=1081102 RepID=A0A162MNU1_9HYPO|nr:dash complex, subunit spc34 [Niveomyces insectorum RCEF 264]